MKARKNKIYNLVKPSPYLQSDFSAIPIDTNTLAGQWMTFSHMANHYRKLLNVKPRINTGLVQSNAKLSKNSSTLSQQSSKVQYLGLIDFD